MPGQDPAPHSVMQGAAVAPAQADRVARHPRPGRNCTRSPRKRDLPGRSKMGRDELRQETRRKVTPGRRAPRPGAGRRRNGSRSAVSRWLSRMDRLASRPGSCCARPSARPGYGYGISLGRRVSGTVGARLPDPGRRADARDGLHHPAHPGAGIQRATQRKLDEILLALPGADQSLLTLEHASDAPNCTPPVISTSRSARPCLTARTRSARTGGSTLSGLPRWQRGSQARYARR